MASRSHNQEKKSGEWTVAWWLIWIVVTIGSFFLAVWFWTPLIGQHFGSIKNPTTTLIWVFAVFGSWLVALAPLMVIMYWKVDKAYEDVRIQREMRQERAARPVKTKSVVVDESRRQISEALSKKLKRIPQTIKGGYLVRAILRDGRTIENVFLAQSNELMGIYDQTEFTFDASDIKDIQPVDLTHPPDFSEKAWLRFESIV